MLALLAKHAQTVYMYSLLIEIKCYLKKET